MTTAVFGHHPWTVQALVDGVASGQVRLPDIQRPFVWSNAKVRDLVDSMYRGYPVGELMFWANRDGGHTRAIGQGSQGVSMQVVDGQQRLTSLFAVMKGLRVWREDYSRERIAVAFSPIHERFEVPTPIVQRSPEWIPDITTVFASPIAARQEFLGRYRKALPEGAEVDEVLIETRINRLHQLQNYLFQVVQLGETVARETVADVFVRINSEGVSLSAADFILTWMSVFWAEGRSELEEFARDSRFTAATITQLTGQSTRWTPHNPFFVVDAGQLLRVEVALGLNRGRLQGAYQTLRGRDPRTREIDDAARSEALEKLQEAQAEVLRPLHWDEFLKVVERAGFRSRAMVTSINLMLYTYAIWLMGRVRFGVSIDPLREVMARWLFMSLLTGRYTNSPETAIQNDLNRLEGLEAGPDAFVAALDGMIDAALPDDWWRVSLPEALVTSSTGAPPFVGFLAALVILDAEVLLSPMKVRDWLNPARRTVKGVELHHLFPKGYLKDTLGVTSTRRINQVANYALVEWSTNIAISDAPPAEYWPKQCADKNFTGERLEQQARIHALPEGWTDLGYEDFLAKRRQIMARVTREGFRRLADPTYTLDLRLETVTAPEPELEAMTLEDLVLGGHLEPGSPIVGGDTERQFVAEITDEGSLRVGTHVYDSPTHAAHELGADVDDGWEFWAAVLPGAEDPVPLAAIRSAARYSSTA